MHFIRPSPLLRRSRAGGVAAAVYEVHESSCHDTIAHTTGTFPAYRPYRGDRTMRLKQTKHIGTRAGKVSLLKCISSFLKLINFIQMNSASAGDRSTLKARVR